MADEVTGEVGFKEEQKEQGLVISKEETMFKTNAEGVAIAERYPMQLYDREIDRELLEEGLMLLQLIKKHKAVNKTIADLKAQQKQELIEFEKKIEKETDEEKKAVLMAELKKKESIRDRDEVQSLINSNVTQDGIVESRESLAELKVEKANQLKEAFVELIPCNTSESYQAFEKNKTVDGKDTDDWVADLIACKVENPKYSPEEARKITKEYKFAMRDAIMAASGYNIKTYRQIMAEKRMAEEKPLQAKKELPTET